MTYNLNFNSQNVCLIVYQYLLQEEKRQTRMKPDFFCVPGLFLVFVAFSSTLGCDPNTGPAGVTRCFLGTPYYSRYQCGTCLTDVYIRQRSRGEHECREPTATYCYYQCMLEKHDLDRGPVSDDCLCNPNVELPQPPVILPPSCYSPGGTDCAWYSQCLHRMFPCTGQAEYAISYGEKFCNLYTHTELQFSPEALQWINAARKCLQVALVSVLHLCQVRPTCEEIKTKAFDSHVPCYVAPYEGFSVCTLPVMDWLRIFWTIKGSFVSSAFLETVKASVLTAANCSSILADRLGEYLYSIPVWLWEKTIKTIIEKRAADDTLSDDELAHTVILHVSSSLGWDQESTMSWYAFAANTNDGGNFMITPSTDQPGRQLIIQVIDRYFSSVRQPVY